MRSSRRTSPAWTASQKRVWISSSDCPKTRTQSGDLGRVARDRRAVAGRPAWCGQSPQLPDHEIHDIVGVALGADAIEVPVQACAIRVEPSNPSSASAVRNWIAKNGLPPVFSWTSSARGPRAFRLAMQGIGDEPADIVEPERRQHDFLHPRSGVADRRQRPHERMRRTDFVVAVGADQQQVPHVRIGNQVLQQFQSCRIQPLQIVEEQRQRMLRAGEGAKEAPEHQLETALRFLRRQFCNGRLFADDELDFGDEVDHQLAIRPQAPPEGRAANGPPRLRS